MSAEVARLKNDLLTAEGVIERNEASIAVLMRERDEAELIMDRTCEYIHEKLPLPGAHSIFENIDALVRDSERLTKLIEMLNFGQDKAVIDLFEKAENLAAEGSSDHEDYQRWVRAAIDKEAGRA